MTADLSSRIKNCDADLPSGNCLAGWHWGEEREDLFNQICLSSFTLFFYQWHLRKTVDLFDQIAVHVSTCLSSVISSSENWCALDVLWWKNELCCSVVFDPLCRGFNQLKASANMRSDNNTGTASDPTSGLIQSLNITSYLTSNMTFSWSFRPR